MRGNDSTERPLRRRILFIYDLEQESRFAEKKFLDSICRQRDNVANIPLINETKNSLAFDELVAIERNVKF